MAVRKLGESKGWTWTTFVMSSCLIGYFGVKLIIDFNGTANKTPIIVGSVIIALLIVGFFLLTLRRVSERSKAKDAD
jgi:hypothetical protein